MSKKLLIPLIILFSASGFALSYFHIPADYSFRDFESPEELKAWVVEDKTNEEPLISFCGQRALNLIENAKKDGYHLHLDIITRDEYNMFKDDWVHTRYIDGELNISEWPELPEGEAHVVASAVIGSEIWYVEPLADYVWKYGDILGGQ